ncbi:MAG: hypothetical protein FWG10_09625 [Eubacteriaceae bacterium]|nr:hypothetical protein [Eubacteriaceae bacterium]
MGYFDWFKKVALNKITEVVDNSPGRSIVETQHRNAYRMSPLVQTSHEEDLDRLELKFDKILHDEFSYLDVAKNVEAERIAFVAATPCKAYSYVVSDNGRIVAVIMLTKRNRDHNAAFLNARSAAQAANLPFLNFYSYYPNERDYIISRIKAAL